MAKSKNLTAHNQSYKAHRNGIEKPKHQRQASTKRVRSSFALLAISRSETNISSVIAYCGANCFVDWLVCFSVIAVCVVDDDDERGLSVLVLAIWISVADWGNSVFIVATSSILSNPSKLQ
jgi:hypothetical protein